MIATRLLPVIQLHVKLDEKCANDIIHAWKNDFEEFLIYHPQKNPNDTSFIANTEFGRSGTYNDFIANTETDLLRL